MEKHNIAIAMKLKKDFKITKSIIISILGVFAAIIIIELMFKMSSAHRVSGVVYDEILGWRAKKINYCQKRFFKKTYSLCTNSKGFRDREHHFVKSKNTARIMFLGDSYTFGYQVSDDKIFTILFEKMITENKIDNNRFDVMNVSAPAWATDQQFLYLKHEGMKYKPDYLFLMIAPNDIRESYGKQFFFLDNKGVLKEKKITVVPWGARFCWFLSNNFCTFQFLQKKVFSTNYGSFENIFEFFPVGWDIKGCSGWDEQLFLEQVPNEVKKARDLFKTLVLSINQLCRKNDCKLILVVLPTKREFDGQLESEKRYHPGYIAEYVSVIASEYDILFLDLFSLLKEEKNHLRIFIAGKYHFNDHGHNFIAEKLYDFFFLKTGNKDSQMF